MINNTSVSIVRIKQCAKHAQLAEQKCREGTNLRPSFGKCFSSFFCWALLISFVYNIIALSSGNAPSHRISTLSQT